MKGMQKIKRGTGFRGVLNYTLEDERGEIIGGNMTGATPKELATEFGQSRQIRADIEKPVWHNSLRLPEGEKIDPEKWATIADDYMKKMGFGELHQRAYILHNDQAGQHIHIVASRVDLTGKIYLGQNENLKSTKIIAELERKHSLTVTRSSQAPNTINRKTITTGEKGLEIRTGEPPVRKQLQAIIDQATADKPPFNVLIRRLHTANVSVLPSGKTGAAQGVSFEINGQSFKGSDLGKSYAWKQLQNRIEFDQSRDQALINNLRQEPSAAKWNARTAWYAAKAERDKIAKAAQEAEANKARAEERTRKEQQAYKIIADFDLQIRQKWREKTHKDLQAEANRHRERHKELNAQEPKSLWKGEKFAIAHAHWVYETNKIRQELIDTLETAKNTIEGKSTKERELQPQIKKAALESLKTHYPELDQVLKDKEAREKQARHDRRQAEELQERTQKSRDRDRDHER